MSTAYAGSPRDKCDRRQARYPRKRWPVLHVSSSSTTTAALTREPPFTGRTAWVRNLETPLRSFLRTETGSAAVLLAAAVAALAWINVDAASYARVWSTTLSR